MTIDTPVAINHYTSAMQAIESLRSQLQQRGEPLLLELLGKAQVEFEQGFWLAHLRVLSDAREVCATDYCRRIPLTQTQSGHLNLLRRGMLEAQQCMVPDRLAAPWNAMFAVRQQFKVGVPRSTFEAGFLIRLYQLLQEARYGVSRWELGKTCMRPVIGYYRLPK
ncbi:hypothetical protein ACLUTX_00920 [Enterobacterales bacterium AE_CKDN230030158-1A_HGKHYDSX7]